MGFFPPYINIYLVNSKQVKDLNVRSETMKRLEEKLHDIGLINDFFNITSKNCLCNNWDYIKLKISAHQRKQQSKKEAYRMRKNIYKSYNDKVLVSKIYKGLIVAEKRPN